MVKCPKQCLDIGNDKRFLSPLFYGIHASEIAMQIIMLTGQSIKGYRSENDSIIIVLNDKKLEINVQLVDSLDEFYSIDIINKADQSKVYSIKYNLDESYYSKCAAILLKSTSNRIDKLHPLSNSLLATEMLFIIMMESKTTKVAIIGYGSMGSIYHKALSDYKYSKVTTIFTSNKKLIGSELSNCETSFVDMSKINDKSFIDKLDIDLVVIATPEWVRQKVIEPFLGQNIYILIDKPLSATQKDTAFFRNLTKKQSKYIYVCNTLAFNPFYSKLISEVKYCKERFCIILQRLK